MKKITSHLLLLLIIAGCQVKNSDSDSFDESLQNVVYTTDDPLPAEAFTFETLAQLFDFDPTREEKIGKALEIIKLVVATEEFRDRILNFTYNGEKAFVDNKGYTNSQIYQIILNGAEKLQPTKNNRMDIEVESYYESSNVVGYTYSSTRRIWVNTKYFDMYTPAGVAHNLFHEWMHKLGFEHASSWSISRDNSVPYAIGYLVGEIGENFL